VPRPWAIGFGEAQNGEEQGERDEADRGRLPELTAEGAFPWQAVCREPVAFELRHDPRSQQEDQHDHEKIHESDRRAGHVRLAPTQEEVYDFSRAEAESGDQRGKHQQAPARADHSIP